MLIFFKKSEERGIFKGKLWNILHEIPSTQTPEELLNYQLIQWLKGSGPQNNWKEIGHRGFWEWWLIRDCWCSQLPGIPRKVLEALFNAVFVLTLKVVTVLFSQEVIFRNLVCCHLYDFLKHSTIQTYAGNL